MTALDSALDVLKKDVSTVWGYFVKPQEEVPKILAPVNKKFTDGIKQFFKNLLGWTSDVLSPFYIYIFIIAGIILLWFFLLKKAKQ